MVCEAWGSHGSVDEDSDPLGCYTPCRVVRSFPTFRGEIPPPRSTDRP